MNAREEVAPIWRDIEVFQRNTADRTNLSDGWHAPDEALLALLQEIESGIVSSAVPSSLRLRRLLENRQRKYPRRSVALQRESYGINRVVENPCTIVERRDLLSWVRKNTSEAEWEYLNELAKGESYNDLSTKFGLSVGTLKARVSRCRLRLGMLAA